MTMEELEEGEGTLLVSDIVTVRAEVEDGRSAALSFVTALKSREEDEKEVRVALIEDLDDDEEVDVSWTAAGTVARAREASSTDMLPA